MENVFEILKDLPKPGDYVLLTVAKGSAAGEKGRFFHSARARRRCKAYSDRPQKAASVGL